jgi:hypothetical protein
VPSSFLGEPGIGKSALLAVARDMAQARGCRVLVAAGVESEAQLPFAAIGAVVRQVGYGSAFALSPKEHRQGRRSPAGDRRTCRVDERCRSKPARPSPP